MPCMGDDDEMTLADTPWGQRIAAQGRGDVPVTSGDAMTFVLPVRVKVLPHGEGLPLPGQGTAVAVGFDLRAATDEPYPGWPGTWSIGPGEQHTIPTGVVVAIPPGYAGLVLSRSGLAHRCRVAVTNAPGLIDPDYRGEVQIILENRGQEVFHYRRGDRLAQLVIVPTPKVVLVPVTDLDGTDRGEGGLGSTGVSS